MVLTGTTELSFEKEGGAKDHWFVGYTFQLVGAIWLGYDKTDQDHFLLSSSSGTATVIFKEIISKSASEIPNKTFDLSLIENKYKQELKKKKYENVRKEKDKKEDDD